MSDCGVCTLIENVCGKLGDREYCEKRLEKENLTKPEVEQALRQIFNKFGEKKFIALLKTEAKKYK